MLGSGCCIGQRESLLACGKAFLGFRVYKSVFSTRESLRPYFSRRPNGTIVAERTILWCCGERARLIKKSTRFRVLRHCNPKP